MQNRFPRWAFPLLTLGLIACGDSSASPDGGAAQGVTITVHPAGALVGPQDAFALTATVSGTADTTVSWSVQEGPGGGSVTADGLYTAPSSTGTFHVVAVANADPTKAATATVTVAGDPPPASGSSMTAAHRTSGVAPLLVFFDAVDTTAAGVASPWAWTSGVGQPSDMEGSEFSWHFGDAGSGVWPTTGLSRNRATGYVAAHVYEKPGTYRVTLTVRSTSGNVSTYVQDVTVTAFAGPTRYASASGTGDGTSESSPSSLAAGIAWLNGGAGRRLLLRRGDTFSTGGITLSAAGPSILGAYGSGARPILNVSSGHGITVANNDWRVMDVDVRAPAADAGRYGVEMSGTRANTLFLRVRAQGWYHGLHGGYNVQHDTPAFVECESAGSYTMGAYVGGRRLAFLGNHVHDPINSHVTRVWMAHKAAISNNLLERTGGSLRHVLKLEGRDTASGLARSRWMAVTNNVFDQGPSGAWAVSVGSQSSAAGEETIQANLLFERNWIILGSAGDAAYESETSVAVIRNNVFDLTEHGSGTTRAFMYERRNPLAPPPNDVRIYGNTVYSGSAGTIHLLLADSTLTNASVWNNLVVAPSAGILDPGGAPGPGFDQGGNLATTAAPSSVFADARGGDFALVATSPAVDAGVELPELGDDFSGNLRPLGGGVDIGAFESH